VGGGIAELGAAADQGFTELLKDTNFPGVIVLGIAAIPTLIILIRWMIKFQREFLQFYIQENKKLRERVDELEEDVRVKDDLILELKEEMGLLRLQVSGQIHTIERLERIVERRKMDRDDGT